MDKQQQALFDLHFVVCCCKYAFELEDHFVSFNEYGLGNT